MWCSRWSGAVRCGPVRLIVRPEPRWGSGAKPPEAEKQDIKFALRIALVNAYCPFYSSSIVTFVTGFSRSSHISDYQSIVCVFHPLPLCLHIYRQICTNLRIESRVGWGAAAPLSPPRGDANVCQYLTVTNVHSELYIKLWFRVYPVWHRFVKCSLKRSRNLGVGISQNTAPATPAPNISLSFVKKDRIDVLQYELIMKTGN